MTVCVEATALDARDAGLKVHLIADATRPIAADSGAAALERMTRSGVVIHGES